MQPALSTSRLIAKVLRELVPADLFDSYADLTVTLRQRLTRLRIPFRQAEFDDAINLVAATRPLVRRRSEPFLVDEQLPDVPPPTRDEARDILAGIRQRLGLGGPRTMPNAAPMSPVKAAHGRWHRGRARALTFVLDELAASEARCTALERQDDDR